VTSRNIWHLSRFLIHTYISMSAFHKYSTGPEEHVYIHAAWDSTYWTEMATLQKPISAQDENYMRSLNGASPC
jgi:hypothetical protein